MIIFYIFWVGLQLGPLPRLMQWLQMPLCPNNNPNLKEVQFTMINKEKNPHIWEAKGKQTLGILALRATSSVMNGIKPFIYSTHHLEEQVN